MVLWIGQGLIEVKCLIAGAAVRSDHSEDCAKLLSWQAINYSVVCSRLGMRTSAVSRCLGDNGPVWQPSFAITSLWRVLERVKSANAQSHILPRPSQWQTSLFRRNPLPMSLPKLVFGPQFSFLTRTYTAACCVLFILGETHLLNTTHIFRVIQLPCSCCFWWHYSFQPSWNNFSISDICTITKMFLAVRPRYLSETWWWTVYT